MTITDFGFKSAFCAAAFAALGRKLAGVSFELLQNGAELNPNRLLKGCALTEKHH